MNSQDPPVARGRRFDSMVLLSGGLDSSVLLYHLRIGRGDSPLAIHFSGLTSQFEMDAAAEIAEQTKTPMRVVDVSSFMDAVRDPALSNFRQGHRVAFANAVVVSIAVTLALEYQVPSVSLALHLEDAEAYVENSASFLGYLEHGVALIGRKCEIVTPFMNWSRAEIVARGVELEVPFEKTWSCSRPVGGKHDGTCSSCLSRRAGFAQSGVNDPTSYAR